MNYQVGDLFSFSWDDDKHLFILTSIPEKDVYIILCMRTYKFYGYSKKGVDSIFRKVS